MLAFRFKQLSPNLHLVLFLSGACKQLPPAQALFSTNAVAEQPGNLPTARFWHVICDLCETETALER